jgi:ketosteroid isomerase-like protein
MTMSTPATRVEREAVLLELAAAYQRRELEVFEAAVRQDMTLTLAGESHLAGTYVGYDAFGNYLQVLRRLMRSAGKPIVFTHDSPAQMTFRQIMTVFNDRHEAEFPLAVTIRYDSHGKIASFLVQPEDQAFFDHLVDTSIPAEMSI